jgi:hypothetical protein
MEDICSANLILTFMSDSLCRHQRSKISEARDKEAENFTPNSALKRKKYD